MSSLSLGQVATYKPLRLCNIEELAAIQHLRPQCAAPWKVATHIPSHPRDPTKAKAGSPRETRTTHSENPRVMRRSHASREPSPQEEAERNTPRLEADRC